MAKRRTLGSRRRATRKPRTRNTRGPMKKTTRKGAYAKNKKAAFQKRRAPMVETKSRTREDVVAQYPDMTDRMDFTTYDTGHLHINPDSFLCMTQGLDEHDCIGRSVYSRYLNLKLSVRWPQASFQIDGTNKIQPSFPQNFELVWGWIPAPLSLTSNTTPAVTTATIDDVHTHMNERVTDYFDQRKDFLRFIPKKASTLRIIGRKKVRPDLRFNPSAAPTTVDVPDTGLDKGIGAIPDWNGEISWRMGKKVHYEKSSNIDTKGSNGMYPNYSWLPWACLVNWSYDLVEDQASTPAARKLLQPSVSWNDIHYFSDS